MNSTLRVPLNHTTDFLAEVVTRSKGATSRRTLVADRLIWLAAIGDAFVIVGAALLAFWLRFHFSLLATHADPVDWRHYENYIALGSVTLLLTISSLGVYDRRLLLRFGPSFRRVCKAWALWLCGVLALASIMDFEPSISRGFVALFSGGAGLGLFLWRWSFHHLCQAECFAASLRERVLLLGWNADAERLSRTMRAGRTRSYDLLGWLPLPREIRPAADSDVACLGEYSELASILKYSLVDVVIFTEREAAREDILDVARICEREMVQFQLVPSYFQILLTGLRLNNIGGLPLLGVSQLSLNQLENRVIKRAFDLVGAVVGLVLSAPLIAIFGALVYLESPGPVFYYQRRVGLKGRPFDIIKIRSMKLDAESNGQVGWSTKDDARRLRIGSFMRRFNIDELPQFWNVFKGELSLVGPRPERPELIAEFKHEIANYNARHTVKPGLTGWAQVHGWRGDTDLTERIRHDLYYMENWSLALDLQILVLTLSRHTNAC